MVGGFTKHVTAGDSGRPWQEGGGLMYQTGGAIKEAIELVQSHKYVLPAIQREFVWKPEQIQP